MLTYESEHHGEFGQYRIVFAGLNEVDDPEIRAALREMYKRYNSSTIEPELQIASALQRGLFQESDVPEEAWPYLQNAMAFMHRNVGEDDVDDD